MTKKKPNPARRGRKSRGEPEATVSITGGKSLIDRYRARKAALKIKKHWEMLQHLLDAEKN